MERSEDCYPNVTEQEGVAQRCGLSEKTQMALADPSPTWRRSSLEAFKDVEGVNVLVMATSERS